MVYDSKTYKPLHDLTKEGREIYERMLESAADEILERNEHPIRYYFRRILEKLSGTN